MVTEFDEREQERKIMIQDKEEIKWKQQIIEKELRMDSKLEKQESEILHQAKELEEMR